jgi:hypothetical protein
MAGHGIARHREGTVLDALDAACRAGVASIHGMHWAGIIIQSRRAPLNAAHTDPLVLPLQDIQYALKDGPSVRALQFDEPFASTADLLKRLWPSLADAANAIGVGYIHSMPLHDGKIAVGSLNLYGDAPLAESEVDAEMLSALSVFIDRALTAYRTAHGGPISTALLQRELQDRELIARAIQCLTVREQIGCDQARTLLLRSAHQRGTTTLTAARRVLRGCPIEVSTNPDPSHQPLAEEVAGR